MEIIDKPLNEIIKEQKIGESLRRNRRGNRGGSGSGDRPRNQQRQQQQQGGGRGARGGRRSNNNNNNRNSSGGGANNNSGRGALRGRLRLRLRARRDGRADPSSRQRQRRNERSGGGRLSQRRFAVDFGDDRRDRSAKDGPRRRVMDVDRNERTRSSRRREALSRARFSRG